MSITVIFYVLAFVCFVLAAIGVPARISWRDAAFAFLTLSLFVR